jgi:lipopolysaccharide/colanic/teichoic acid biosynthesis glycosyltransferase
MPLSGVAVKDLVTAALQHGSTAAQQQLRNPTNSSNSMNPMKPMNILPKSQFLNCLRIEKRRVDRSKAPLSIVLFYFHREVKEGEGSTGEFLRSLLKNTRETDIKGWIDRDIIGLVLPDTDGTGVEKYIEKIRNGNGGLTFSAVTGTYPDDLFNKLLTDDQSQPDLFPINLDESKGPKKIQLTLKRGVDILGAVTGLLIFLPIMLITALAIKLTSAGPIIFKQNRFGKEGVRFPFYKFRSMLWNTDDQVHREYVTNLIKGDLEKINQGEGGDPLYKMKSDPRITKVGKIIRKTSIDELPQFFNVLKGEMSLVGPRPPLLYEVEEYEPWHLRRILEVKPGITGLWQVDGRSKTSFDDMVRMDLRYVQNWSLWLDIKILIKTVGAVIRPNGAL